MVPDPADVQTTVVPMLGVERGVEAVAFYIEAFAAVVEFQVGGDAENPSVVAQLCVGDGARFWVADSAPEVGSHSPEHLGGSTVRMLIITGDVDGLFARALAAGATEVRPVTEEYGWRIGHLSDPYGHQWEIGRPLEPWPPSAGSH